MTQRITISLTDETAARLDALMLSGGYGNRSEAVRDLIREKTADDVTARGDGSCVAVVSYVYNHHERQLAARTRRAGGFAHACACESGGLP